MPEQILTLVDQPDGKGTLWTATNNAPEPVEVEVRTERGTRVLVVLQPGAHLQLITSNQEDANILTREIKGNRLN
ncbi:hypothetical protein FQZ97_772620 [compost metagenome]